MTYITFFQFLHRCFLLDAEKHTPLGEILTETRNRPGAGENESAQPDFREQAGTAEGRGPPPD